MPRTFTSIFTFHENIYAAYTYAAVACVAGGSGYPLELR